MSRLFLDTNILLDYIVPDRPESDEALELIKQIVQGKHKAHVLASSLKDAYYVTAKHIGEQAARDWVRIFLRIFEIEELDAEVSAVAAGSDEPDYEDGCIRAGAERAQVDFLVTRDRAAYARSWIKTYTAREFLALFPGEDES